jgi:hypothetical protein
MGDLAIVPSRSPRLATVLRETTVPGESTSEVREALVPQLPKIPSADGASLSAVSVKVDGSSTWPDDDTGGSLWDLVMCGTNTGVAGSAASGDATRAPRYLDTVGLGVFGLLLSGSPGILPPPINVFIGRCRREVVA